MTDFSVGGFGAAEVQNTEVQTNNAQPEMSMKPPNQHPLHVHLGFNLYADRKQKNPTEAELEQIMAVFPTCYAATLMNPLLILHYETFPPRPWPLTIAGLPVYLTTELKLSPLPRGLSAGGSPLEIGATVCLWKTPTVDAMMEIFRGFDARKLPIKAIRWFGVRFLVEVEGEPPQNWKSVFPRRINKLQVSYIFGGKAGAPGSLRLKQPTDAEPDDANYSKILRPGVILSSGIGPDGFELRTTSGVCVSNRHQEQNMSHVLRTGSLWASKTSITPTPAEP